LAWKVFLPSAGASAAIPPAAGHLARTAGSEPCPRTRREAYPAYRRNSFMSDLTYNRKCRRITQKTRNRRARTHASDLDGLGRLKQRTPGRPAAAAAGGRRRGHVAGAVICHGAPIGRWPHRSQGQLGAYCVSKVMRPRDRFFLPCFFAACRETLPASVRYPVHAPRAD
jgi:hypothetical protein